MSEEPKMSKKIIVTGISGSGSKDFCKKYSKRHPNLKIYNTGNMIEALVPEIPPENILNLNPDTLEDLRRRTFDEIVKNIEIQEPEKTIILDTHAQFYWNKILRNTYDWTYLDKISANMFITIIDRPSAIRNNQLKTEQGRSQTHSIEELLLWQNAEVNMTEGWAKQYKKPMYILPSKQDPKIVDNLLENKFLIYFSMPMTYADREENRRIEKFYQNLLKIGKKINRKPTPIIDPRTIDLESDTGLSNQAKLINERQTIHRDLDWYIGRATHVVGYYPPRSIISLGVSQEVLRASETGKTVYMVCPERKRMSPFMRKSNRIFSSEEEFFNFFPEQMKKDMERFERNQ